MRWCLAKQYTNSSLSKDADTGKWVRSSVRHGRLSPFYQKRKSPSAGFPGIPLQVSDSRKPQGKRRRTSVHALEALGR